MDVNGRLVLNDIGEPVTTRRHKFRFIWSRDHFEYGTDQYITKLSDLDEDARGDYALLQNFVQGLPAVSKVDRSGKPVVDEDGEIVREPGVINIKELLASGIDEGAFAYLGIFPSPLCFVILTCHFVVVAFDSGLMTD